MKIGFDFDGVICDGTGVAIDILNIKFAELNRKPITLQELRKKGLKEILVSRQLTPDQLHETTARGREMFAQQLPNMKTYDGISAALTRLYQNHNLTIVSSNAKTSVETFLRNNHLYKLFSEVIGDQELFSKDEIIKQQGFDFYVGDETRDINAAHKAGVKAVSVTWGWESEKLLAKSHPDFIARKPEDLLTIFS